MESMLSSSGLHSQAVERVHDQLISPDLNLVSLDVLLVNNETHVHTTLFVEPM